VIWHNNPTCHTKCLLWSPTQFQAAKLYARSLCLRSHIQTKGAAKCSFDGSACKCGGLNTVKTNEENSPIPLEALCPAPWVVPWVYRAWCHGGYYGTRYTC
jgi:hypothetical protein